MARLAFQEIERFGKNTLKEDLTLSQPGFFVLQNQRGHNVPPPLDPLDPLAKTMLPFSESIQVKVFVKACPKMNLLTQLLFHGNRG